jgi:hypothetical protein
VRFDESTGEYEFVTPSGGRLNIYHCPFCGGAMPRSRRAELFAYITQAEVERLDELTRGFRSVDEAVCALGPPDTDIAVGHRERTPARGRQPPRVTGHRTLTFSRLSETADVHLIDCAPEGIRFTYVGKYLGRGKKGPPNKQMQRTRPAQAKKPRR